MTTYEERKDRARAIELGSTAGASTVGVGFGAAKLRDAYKEEHPQSFKRGVRAVGRATKKVTGETRIAGRAMRIARKGKPGFAPLVVASALAGTASAARKYQGVESLRQKRHEAEREGVAKSMPLVPTRAAHRAGGVKPQQALYRPKHNTPTTSSRTTNGARRVFARAASSPRVGALLANHGEDLPDALDGLSDVIFRKSQGARMTNGFGIDHAGISKAVSEQEREKLAHQKHPEAQPDGSFPTPDKKHARLALSFLKDAPPSQRAAIRARADKKLDKGMPGLPGGKLKALRVTDGKQTPAMLTRLSGKHEAPGRRALRVGVETAAPSRPRHLAKAFDSEGARHRRSDAYAGGAAGGAVLAGGASAKLGRVAHQQRETSRARFRGVGNAMGHAVASHDETVGRYKRHMIQPGKPGNLPRTGAALRQTESGTELLHRNLGAAQKLHGEGMAALRSARRAGHGAVGTGAAAVGLAGAAAALARSDRKGHGRTYSYR